MPLNIAFYFWILVKYIFQGMKDVVSKDINYTNIKQAIKQQPILPSQYVLLISPHSYQSLLVVLV